jgi:hypothetical protein
VAIDDWRSKNRAETYTRLGTGAPASNKLDLLRSSLIFYFVAIDDPRKMHAKTYTRQGTVPQRVIILVPSSDFFLYNRIVIFYEIKFNHVKM